MIQYFGQEECCLKWNDLFAMQQKLDTYIIDQQSLEGQDVLEEKFLALLVELGELANETRCFKFWSQKASSEKTVVLEEYVDNIHFLLSIGLEKGYTFSEIVPDTIKVKATTAFNHAFSSCLTFYRKQSEENYHDMFKQFIQLANVLGFSETDIIQAYHEKNAVNYERQENGY